jgi:hypothetical protein
MADKPLWQQFALSFREHWFAAMSGGASVPFVIAAVYVDNKYGQALLAICALVCAAFASYRVWKPERFRVRELEERLAPKIKVSLDPSYGIRIAETRLNLPPGVPAQRGPDSKYVQIMVRSATDAPLIECEARLIRVERIGDREMTEVILTEPTFCTWSRMEGEEQKRMTIPAKISQAANLFRVQQGNPRLDTLTTNVHYDFDAEIQRAGNYKLTIAVYAKDCPTEIISLIFKWSGSYE